MASDSRTHTPTPDELERIRRVLKDEEVVDMLSNMHTCYEADEDHGGVADEDVDGETIQRARDLELALNWLSPGYMGPAFPDDWLLRELSKLRAENNAMREVLDELDAELDRQLYDKSYVKSCRDNDLDIGPGCEHHVIVRQKLREKITAALELDGSTVKGPASHDGLVEALREIACGNFMRPEIDSNSANIYAQIVVHIQDIARRALEAAGIKTTEGT